MNGTNQESGEPRRLTVIVTGASSGIGAAIARELHGRGHRVALVARREQQLHALARELSPAGLDVRVIVADVSRAEDRARLLEETTRSLGPVDVLVNNAGVGGSRGKPLWERDGWEQVLQVNLLALVDLTRRVLPAMIARGRGHVINVGSVAGHVGTEPLYSASKFGVRGFSAALRRQLRGTGVTVSLVSPGFVRSEMTQDMTWKLPGAEVVARAVARLIDQPRREVIVPPVYQGAVWLERLWPTAVDAVVARMVRARR